MRKAIILTSVITAVLCAAAFTGCEELKKALGQNESAPTASPPPTAVSTPAPAPKEPFKAWDKNKYFDMLHKGYKPPARTVTTGGYTSSGSGSVKTREISEKEGEGLKYKYGEGKKFAASGRGDDPKLPDFIENDENR